MKIAATILFCMTFMMNMCPPDNNSGDQWGRDETT